MGNSLVGPYDTNADEANNHGGPKRMRAKVQGRVDGKFVGPYTTSKEEAGGHRNGNDMSDGENTTDIGGERGHDVKHW